MSDYSQRVSDSFYERKRLIRLRRKKENLRFWEEFRVIPRWLTALVAVLYVIALVTAVSLMMAVMIFMVAYVNRDASRRGMSAALWTILVIILLPAWGFIGFVIYFLMREPLPYPCPQCGNSVGARFNFCPNCKCNLHPSCPHCKREVAETDKFCPFCGNDLKAVADVVEVSSQNSI